ncbi:GTP-binding protein [Candidatus Clostridium radicumherbarum]|uniref:GTP-binding protein n=1 Tax=Candidatus Clostridium radicumherbarum TaxID=3381662 RepID=A0ABW8TU33_9CLOT
MNIKTEIEIVTGFLGSGKTTFINALLENSLVSGEIVIIIQGEIGNADIKIIEKPKSKLIIRQVDNSKNLTAAFLKQMIDFYNPHRIIVEYNGTKLLMEILNVLEDGTLVESLREPIIYNLLEASTFFVYYNNMKELIEPFIINSNLIVINNCSNISLKEKNKILKKLKELNPRTIILTNDNLKELEEVLKKAEIIDRGLVKKVFIKIKNRQANKAVRSR